MNAIIESSCELWILTKQLKEKIDIIQRQLVWRILNILLTRRCIKEQSQSSGPKKGKNLHLCGRTSINNTV